MSEQSLADLLKYKFWNDLQEISKSLCEKHHLKYNPNDEQPIRRWISFVARLIEPKERFSYFSKGFWTRIPKECISAVHLLADKFEYGENVNPYQSKTIKLNNLSEKKGRRTDLLWADWNIHHFHLPTSNPLDKDGFSSRSEYLLFAYVGNDYVCFLDVKHHKDDDCFSNPFFIQQIVESWPQLAESKRIKGISIGDKLNAKEIAEFRKNGLMAPISLNGNVYMMGQGISTAGTPTNDIVLYDMLLSEIELLSKDLTAFLNRRSVQASPKNFSLEIKEDGLNLFFSKDGSFSNIKIFHLEHINRFFNQLWLLKPTLHLDSLKKS